MWFRKNQLRFVDTLQFFQQPLADLSATYAIDTIKRNFPHHFNTTDNQNYVGKIFNVEAFGVTNMSPDKFKDFTKWYETAKEELWEFKPEMKNIAGLMLNY